MKIELDISKTIEKNAEYYYEKAKKSKRKVVGAESALKKTFDKLEKLKNEEPEVKTLRKVEQKKKYWYEKYRWFISSEGFLCVGGRDATTNDIIVKKNLDKNDVVFHTEAPGSPFFVIKCEGKKPGDATLNEAAQATASFSRAWRNKLSMADVFSFSPDQVKKEFGLPKGAFMVYGKRNYFKPVVELAIGITAEGVIMCGPHPAIMKNCAFDVLLRPGNTKKSDIAKDVKRKFEHETTFKINLDDVMQALPPGDCSIVRNH
jgi:predicted ribosome quality control (RQC) complex YloA/Tae2 family protein